MRIEGNNEKNCCHATLSSHMFYVDDEINNVKINESSMKVHMDIKKHLVIGKNESLAWIDEVEKTNTKVHKVERIDFINIEQLTQDMKLMAMKSSKNDNFDMALFYNFTSERKSKIIYNKHQFS